MRLTSALPILLNEAASTVIVTLFFYKLYYAFKKSGGISQNHFIPCLTNKVVGNAKRGGDGPIGLALFCASENLNIQPLIYDEFSWHSLSYLGLNAFRKTLNLKQALETRFTEICRMTFFYVKF